MGLDISLIRIVKEPVDELCWLHSEESPELLSDYKDFLTEQTYEDGTIARGYWYEELSYQRKGVRKSFYDQYEPDEFLFTQSQLMRLNKYILPEKRRTFQFDFIQKFNEGDNFIMIGY